MTKVAFADGLFFSLENNKWMETKKVRTNRKMKINT
jgi:hypothetical protein